MFLLEGNLQILFTFSFCYCFFYALMQYIFMPTTLFHRSTGGSEKMQRWTGKRQERRRQRPLQMFYEGGNAFIRPQGHTVIW